MERKPQALSDYRHRGITWHCAQAQQNEQISFLDTYPHTADYYNYINFLDNAADYYYYMFYIIINATFDSHVANQSQSAQPNLPPS